MMTADRLQLYDRDVLELSDATIVSGWFPRPDGRPLWLAECLWKETQEVVREHGDTRDEAFIRIMRHSKPGGES